MVVGECAPCSDPQAGSFEAVKELPWECDAAEGGHGAIDGGDLYGAMQAPDRSLPTPGAEFCFQLGVVGWNRHHGSAAGGLERLAEIACRKQAIAPIALVEQQNVNVAVELAVLKAVIEKMNAYLRG